MRFSGYAKPYKISGDYGERDPPVPMPNTEVKPFSADGTWLETTWESRTLPDSTKKSLRRMSGAFLCVSGEILLPAHLRRSQRTYLVRIFPAARSAGFQAGKITWESRRKNAKETFFISSANPNAPVIFDQVRERTWFGSTPCAACGGNSTGMNTWESRALPYICGKLQKTML